MYIYTVSTIYRQVHSKGLGSRMSECGSSLIGREASVAIWLFDGSKEYCDCRNNVERIFTSSVSTYLLIL